MKCLCNGLRKKRKNKGIGSERIQRVFSHDGKVHILNLRILNYAVYTRATEFAVLRSRAGRRGVAVSGYSLCCLRFLCFSVCIKHVQRAVL